jgi:hypothetical protein
LFSCSPQLGRYPAIPPLDDAPHNDPARAAQSRLLREAYRAFVQERYPAAALFFQRFIDDASDSPRLAEAHWWLGRTLEQLGNYRAAMAQYRTVAAGLSAQQVNGALYERHALRRLDELRQLSAGRDYRQSGQLALRITVSQVPPASSLAPWLQDLVQEGVTVLVLEPGETLNPGRGVFNPETVQGLVREAHRVGLQLWVALDLHQGRGMDLRPEWMATASEGLGLGSPAAPRPDIAHPAYQAYLDETIRGLSRAGCDGIFLAARPMTGFAEEFSGESFRAFASTFGLGLSPEDIFTVRQSTATPTQERSAHYWRWAGWKALTYARLVVRLRKVLQESNPTATMLVEVHQTTLTAPLDGLAQYGEDVAELMPRNGGSVAVKRGGAGGEMPLDQLARLLGSIDRMWVGISAKTATVPPSITELKKSIVGGADSGRWNLLIQAESAQSVP